jgi:two-component system sensor histidine kinase GlrK
MKFTGIFGRLAITNIILLIFISIFLVYVFHKTEQIQTMLHEVTAVNLPIISDTVSLNESVQRINEFRLKYILTGDEDFLEAYKSYRNQADETLRQLHSIVAGENKLKSLKEVSSGYERFKTISDSQIELHRVNPEHVSSIINTVSMKLESDIQVLREIADKERQSILRRSGRMVDRLQSRSIIFMVLCMVAAGAVAFFNTRTIAVPLMKLGEKTNEIAAGRFPEKFSFNAPDEIKKLAADFNIMITRLKEGREQKEEFVSNVSHELKTPLSSIKEAALMLKEDVIKNDPESSQKLLEIIEAETERLIGSVHSIIEISKLDINDAPYDIRKCDMKSVINDIVSKTAPIARSKKIAVIVDIDEKLPSAAADPEIIGLTVENIISNALKYTPEKGEIVISAVETDERMMLISVKDNGRGIDEDELSHIFERYRRGRNQSGGIKGTGLGLAIAKKIVARHGGDIWVKSKTGEGSEFLFTLPLSY